jgi:hypothetical protein
VAERTPPPAEPIREGSRGPWARFAGFRSAIGRSDPLALTVLALGALAALLLAVAEFSTIASIELTNPRESCESQLVDPQQRERCTLSGFDRHGGAFLLLAVLMALMAWGAGVGASRPAAVALSLVGAVVLVIALAVDLPVTDDTGAIGRNFEGARAHEGAGLYLEVVAGVLAIAAGARRLTSARRA